MGIIACKFGGTSTANADMFKKIYAILSENPDRRYAVLSAPGRDNGKEKVTDLLYRGDVDAVVERFDAIARSLHVEMDFRRDIEHGLQGSRAFMVSRGEYLCARLFSKWSGIPFVDAGEVILFNADGSVNQEATQRALREMAARHPRAVIPGFYGSDSEGNIVTFPRNGSDITGALVAAGVGASLYENWTDVPGLMTGDPDVDPGARIIPEISYAALRRRAAEGLQVLHPDSLDAVERAGIPTRIKCTVRPDAPGTLVHLTNSLQ